METSIKEKRISPSPLYNKCCRCEKVIMSEDIFSFRKCLNTHGRWAHRYCPECWWGFIVPNSEKIHFKCFGCEKHWPLWYFPKTKRTISKQQQVIQL